MFNGESKKRPTVSLRGKSKEEDRGEFLRRARTQREGRARERLHSSSATTIQRFWRGRSCVNKWRQQERHAWDRKMHDIGRVKVMLAAAGKELQLPPAVLLTLLSQLMNFHAFPQDAGRFRAAIDLVLVAAPLANAGGGGGGGGLFAPPVGASSGQSGGDSERQVVDNAWSLLVARLGTVCLQYIGQAAGLRDGAGAGGVGENGGAVVIADVNMQGGGAMTLVGAGSSEIRGAVESAIRGFALLSSPGSWRHRWPSAGEAAVASGDPEKRCRALMSSLALGRIVFGGSEVVAETAGAAAGEARLGSAPPEGGSKARSGVRLWVRAERDGGTGEWTRTPRLFAVLRVVWDAAAAAARGGSVAGECVEQAVRLLCSSSFQALEVSAGGGVGASESRLLPGKNPSSRDPPILATSAALLLERRELLEEFAAAILPAPRLLEHPLRALLMDPMLAGDAGAWWEVVSMAGESVGARGGAGFGGCGGAARRRDVAWAVANILKVDTGGSGADRAKCLVRTLCKLLRKVSLHALLKGARRTAGAGRTAGAAASAGDDAKLAMDASELVPEQLDDEDDDDDDDDDVMMGDVFTTAAADMSGTGAAPGGGFGRADIDSGGVGIRLEAVVRHYRRRCAVRTESLAAESPDLACASKDPLSTGAHSTGSKRRGMTPGGGRGSSGRRGGGGEEERERVMAMVSGEVEAMSAAAGRLSDPGVVGRLFDSILPPISRIPPKQDQQVEPARRTPSAAATVALGAEPFCDSGIGNGNNSGGMGDGYEDPVSALCSLYADLVMDGVRAGSAAAAAAGGGPDGSATVAATPVAPGKSVLNALAFGRPKAPIAARLWTYLQRRQDFWACATRGGGSGGERREEGGGRGGVQSTLFLFCSACSHQLLALDDEEFYEKQRPLTLDEVRKLASFLKDWLCRLYWLDPVMPRLLDEALPSDPTAALRQCEDRLREALLLLSATRLFNQLYERNTRRSFLTAESWYWKAIAANELSLADREDPRVAFLSRGNLGMVLTNIPQVVPFFQRVVIFRQMIDRERWEHQGRSGFNMRSSRIRVSRESLYEDSAEELTMLGSALKGRIQVTFMNQHGVEEAGIDGGGVFKEYMDLLTKRAFDPQYALFLATEDQYLFPNPGASMVAEDYLFHFEFLGRVLAKAVFEDILVEPQFSPVFLNKLLGKFNYIDDLYSLDPELYRNLMQLKTIVQSGGDVADLCLTFSASTTAFGESKEWDLIPGGRDVAVTNASVISYIHLMAHFKLNVQTARPCKAFMQGFRDLIPVEWIRLFNPHELQRLIGGEGGRAIDVEDLKQNTVYAGGYHQSQPVMQWFWEAIESFSPEEQGQFLKFVTSCSRPPLLGFARLKPPICLQRVPEGEEGRLPSSATCMNLLKLPQYSDRQTLREKLLYAISANAGFELT